MSKSRSVITNTEDFVKRVQSIHGDRYDYTNVVYTGRKNKVKVVCELHGDFYVFADKFSCPKAKRGCPTCGKLKTIEANLLRGINSFRDKSPIIHNNKYTYEKFLYTKSCNKSEVTCPVHGGFLVSPNIHLGGAGCPTCSEEHRSPPSSKITKKMFLDKCKELHGDTYTYGEDCFTSKLDSVKFLCPEHGDIVCTYTTHLKVSGTGCPKCNIARQITKITESSTSFIDKCREVHDNKYTYTDTIYTTAHENIVVTCPTHGNFSTRAGHHKRGIGCAKCGSITAGEKRTGFYNVTTIERHKEVYLGQSNNVYLLELQEGRYKIGVAMRVNSRMSCIKKAIGGNPSVIAQVPTNTYDAFYLEQYLHEMLEDFRHIYEEPWTGHTEVFDLTQDQLKYVYHILDSKRDRT